MIIIGKVMVTEDIEKLKKQLACQLETMNLGRLSSFLGVTFSLDRDGGSLSQERYDEELLRRFEMRDCRPVATPAVVEAKDED